MLIKPIQVAIVGMGGFAATHHDTIARMEQANKVRLVATADPAMDQFSERIATLRLADRGVQLFTDYREMLDTCHQELDVVHLPTPIPLHAPMSRVCVEHGLPVYLEKPPTLDYRELEQMIEVDSRAQFKTQVGFNFIVEPQRQALKQRLVDGEFGQVHTVCAWALWPRPAGYYHRSAWAGRLEMEGRLVLDSCIGNAMAHQVHNALFWCGTGGLMKWGSLSRAQAELYRAHNIQGLDTAFIGAAMEDGLRLRIAMTHACTGAHAQEERVECEKADLVYHINNSGPNGALYEIHWKDGRSEVGGPADQDIVSMNFKAYYAYLRGETNRPLTSLMDSRPFVHLNNLAYVAGGHIQSIPHPYLQWNSDQFVEVQGLDRAVREFVGTGIFPSSQGQPWAAAGGVAAVSDLPKLESVITRIAQQA